MENFDLFFSKNGLGVWGMKSPTLLDGRRPFKTYQHLKTIGHKHIGTAVPPEKAHEDLHWVHIAISNAKRFLVGTHHGVSHKHLQRYLDEFCYRFNRRAWGKQMTSRLLTACISAAPIIYAGLRRLSFNEFFNTS